MLLLLLLWHRGLGLGQELLVVAGDNLAHVGAGGVRQLEGAPVEYFPQWAVFGEALVNMSQELSPNVCFDIN